MSKAHTLGYPRIGLHRELKQAVERYWRGEIDQTTLETVGATLRARHWRAQAEAGLDFVTVGDFSWYDQVLDMSVMLGVVPARFADADTSSGAPPSAGSGSVDLNTYFRMARGRSHAGDERATTACEMTKWFDTNYHYLVPEFVPGQTFRLASTRLFEAVEEARALGYRPKPVILGPLSYLWLGKLKTADNATQADRLALLEALLPVYGTILSCLREQGVEWVQIDEPILVLDLPEAWQRAFEQAYHRLQVPGLKRMLATYFGGLGENTALACRLPVDGLHIDLVRAPQQLVTVLDQLPPYKVLSAGVVDGRNIWRCDLDAQLPHLQLARTRLGERLWVAPSCSLLHVPMDLAVEHKLDEELRGWLAFARQKLDEVVVLKRALTEGEVAVAAALNAARTACASRRRSVQVSRPEVAARVAAITPEMARRAHPYTQRAPLQRVSLGLPLYPTTTIGSFPQTADIRAARRDWRQGRLDETGYQARMRAAVAEAVRRQEQYGLDVLVHGEAERTDMVEYFGEQLDGFAFTANSWVQSYGSRCVKPPIIFGDVSRPAAMTVEWARYAQSLTQRPMKGMLTGPVTLLQWSFVRDDQPRETTCLQLALALRDEVLDLERAGIRIIQIDEPALREGLPLRERERGAYLDWAVRAFRLAAAGVRDATQIHTHMCYAEFNDIIEAIAVMDADVITIETSRSDMELLKAFEDFAYPNELGPGVYDIHSPNIPTVEAMVALMEQAVRRIPAEHLWVNPDCGLKTRAWAEVDAALANMVEAARRLRARANTNAPGNTSTDTSTDAGAAAGTAARLLAREAH